VPERPGAVVLADVDAPEAGAAAFAAGVEVHELVPGEVNLEEVFLRLTGGHTDVPTAGEVAA
jgi:ABC-2 type transport system ATP-binding protein